MLGKSDATPMIAVKDLDRARRFYEETLGLEAKQQMGGEVLTVQSGRTPITVYRSEFAGTNKATALTFDVDIAPRFDYGRHPHHVEMTENGAVTLIKLDDPDGLAFSTDGCPLHGVRAAFHYAACIGAEVGAAHAGGFGFAAEPGCRGGIAGLEGAHIKRRPLARP